MKETPVLDAIRKLLSIQGQATVGEIAERAEVPQAKVLSVLRKNTGLYDLDDEGRVIGLTGLTHCHVRQFETTKEASRDADHWKE